jgi:hypothetical protein
VRIRCQNVKNVEKKLRQHTSRVRCLILGPLESTRADRRESRREFRSELLPCVEWAVWEDEMELYGCQWWGRSHLESTMMYGRLWRSKCTFIIAPRARTPQILLQFCLKSCQISEKITLKTLDTFKYFQTLSSPFTTMNRWFYVPHGSTFLFWAVYESFIVHDVQLSAHCMKCRFWTPNLATKSHKYY